ncbi:hypothetical protein WNY51_18215 [Pseudocolwellia sp. AS88]|uniref:hypothetical protein n=1 Tax=Pseudocolwellia sp. AS88 TaxID=3063958 RepID=UPI0026F2C960|nr:hypothetical protein [Pseudocolwellia sp. AS88]MDO7085510.1 hypothetical protein [Pseudocolwellia sp. AS88]
MNKHVLLTLLSVFLVACSSNTPPENKNLIPISQYLDLTTKDGKKVPLNKQKMLFHKYWKVQLFG